MRIEPRKLVIPLVWIVFAVIAYYLPYATSAFRLLQFQQVIYMTLAVMSLNMLSGMSGQISVGQSAYVGASAYLTALLVQNQGWSYWAALPFAILLGFFIGGLTGLPALRITGIRLALATLSIAIVFPAVPVKFGKETGGSPGMNVLPLKVPDSWGITSIAYTYWILLTGAVIVFLIVRNIMASRIGRSMIAIRDQQVAAHTVGINVSILKVMVFGASGAICGLVGWMFVITNNFVSPADFSVLLSIYLLAGMAIGGSGTLVGPIFGGIFLIYAPIEIANVGASPLLTPVMYGAALVLILLFLPQGVGGLLQKLGRKIVGPPAPTKPPRADALASGDPDSSPNGGGGAHAAADRAVPLDLAAPSEIPG